MPVPPPPNATQVYKGVRHEIWEWDQELYDGSHATFACLVREDTVSIIPFLDAQTVLLIREEQPGRGEPFFDVPGGCIDKNETPTEAATRELAEETGYQAVGLQLFRESRFTGMSRFVESVFLAKHPTNGIPQHLDPGERITLVPTSWTDAVRMSLRGELRRRDVMLAILAMEFDPEARAIKERFLAS